MSPSPRIWPGAALLLWAAALAAQEPLTRAQAVDRALTRGAQAGIAAADAAVASAELRTARAFPNPLLSLSYSKSTPQLHAIAELPVDYAWLRRARVRAAEATSRSARYRTAFALASLRFEAETTYVRALALAERARLSRRTAADADSLVHLVRARRDAGDASEMDVQLALITAGQAANTAAGDSLAAASAILDLQLLIGVGADGVAVRLTDSLTPAPIDGEPVVTGAPLPVVAAEEALRSAEQTVALQRRSLLASTAITGGVEWRDPSGSEPGVLPTFGVSVPLPLLNRNRGEIAAAAAQRDRARLELTLARREAELNVARSRRERATAAERVARDRALVTSAERVASMSLSAYAEGAVPLANVLEAQRSARESLAQYVDDIAALDIAVAALRLFTTSERAP